MTGSCGWGPTALARISRDWRFSARSPGIGVDVEMHGVRHARASCLLAGGADLQVVKERLGRGSIRHHHHREVPARAPDADDTATPVRRLTAGVLTSRIATARRAAAQARTAAQRR